MKREIEIIAFGAERKGVSNKSGEPWYNRDLVVQWFEEGPNGRYEQQTVVSINKRLNPLLLEQAVKNREKITMTIYFGYFGVSLRSTGAATEKDFSIKDNIKNAKCIFTPEYTKTTNAVTGKSQLSSRALGSKGDFDFVIKNPVKENPQP